MKTELLTATGDEGEGGSQEPCGGARHRGWCQGRESSGVAGLEFSCEKQKVSDRHISVWLVCLHRFVRSRMLPEFGLSVDRQ